MSHEEITTKLEITQNGSQKVVRVDFSNPSERRGRLNDDSTPASASPIHDPSKTIVPSPMPRVRRSGIVPPIDLRAPWVIRLIAVMAVLLLSLLVL